MLKASFLEAELMAAAGRSMAYRLCHHELGVLPRDIPSLGYGVS